MIDLILTSALIYFVWVLIYLQRNRIKTFFRSNQKPFHIFISEEDPDDDIMGKTKIPAEMLVAIPIRSARIDNNELDAVFSDTPEQMELDVLSEYNEKKLLEEEELICLLDNETIQLAIGVHYDELENLIQVMTQKQNSPEAEYKALSTIQQLNETELFHLLVSQIGGSKERVTEMLNKYKIDSVESDSNVKSPNADFLHFEIDKFL